MSKRILKNIFLILLTAVILTGCTTAEETEGTEEGFTPKAGKNSIIVLNYGEYIERGVLDTFEEETGIKVYYEEATTPEEMYAKYMGGSIDYDLICTSDYMIEKMIEDGVLSPIDHSKMQYIDNIGEQYFKMSETFDPGNVYSIPYFWGTVGILYNKTMVHDEIDSWDDLFNGEYAGDIIMPNSIRDCYMCALKQLGYSMNTTDKDELYAAQQLLLDQKKDVEAYFVDEVREEMVAGNAILAVCYSGEAYLAHEYSDVLQYVVPKEGSNLWIDSWCMTNRSKNKEGALKFLDFLCRDDIAMINFEEVYYPTPNIAVYNELDEEEKTDPFIFPDEEVIENSEVYKTLDEETTRFLGERWKELKVE